jgi:hypothetical protein
LNDEYYVDDRPEIRINTGAETIKALKSWLFLALAVVALCLLALDQASVFCQAKTPKIVENTENPKYSTKDAPELIFRKEITIPLIGRRYSFDVDEEGNIYLLESLEGIVSVYDKNGKPVGQFGKKGQGPGEFENSVFLALSRDRKIHIIDRPKRAIQIFDASGRWLGQRQLHDIGMMNSLCFDSRGFAYIQDMRNLFALNDQERIRRGIAGLSRLSKFGIGFEKIQDVAIWDNRFLKKVAEGYSYVLYHDIFYYQLDEKDRLYYGDSSKYEICQMAPDGHLNSIIRKRVQRIPTTEKDRANFLRDFPEFKQAREMAATKPYFLDFHVLDGIGLLVGTYADEWNEAGTILCDFFDREGAYIAEVRAPRYYSRDQDAISEQRNRLFKNGCCYSLEYNKQSDSLELVRHRVELRWPRRASRNPRVGRTSIFRGGNVTQENHLVPADAVLKTQRNVLRAHGDIENGR